VHMSRLPLWIYALPWHRSGMIHLCIHLAPRTVLFTVEVLLIYVLNWKIRSFYYIWPPHVKSWLIGKDSDAGRDWGQEEKGTTEDEMDGWHHWLDGCESGWTPGVGDGQGGLACCNSWGRKESDTTEQLNVTELSVSSQYFYGIF